MATFSVDSSGFDNLVKRFDKVASRTHSLFVAVCSEASLIAYEKVLELVPVDTGVLKASLRMQFEESIKECVITLSSNCPYAWFNEFGWSGIPPVPEPPATAFYKSGYRPFMRVAMLEAQAYVFQQLGDIYSTIEISNKGSLNVSLTRQINR